MNILVKILDILFPSKCTGCQKSGSYLCEKCADRAQPDEYVYENCALALDYRNPAVRSAIHMLKYKGKRSIATDLAKRTLVRFEKLLSEISKQGSDHFIIVPLPLHKVRKRERGYNQSELLAKAFVKISKIKNIQIRNDVLIKTKATETQVSRKNKSDRAKNLKDCFKVTNLKNTQNKNIIVLDDIITTGSTLQEAKRTLEKAGVKNVLLFALAH